MTAVAIETEGLVKAFGETRAVDGIDLEVAAGTVYGVLGPNGAGKTSMMVLFPLTFASNVFVDPATMPGWLQAAVKANPITHLTSAARGLMHAEVDGTEILWVLGWSAALVLVFAPLTIRLYHAER